MQQAEAALHQHEAIGQRVHPRQGLPRVLPDPVGARQPRYELVRRC